MAYPATRFTIIDNSDNNYIEVPEEDTLNRPVYMCVFASDKGPEEWQTEIMGQKFYDLYGTPSFAKYGQESIQTANIINNGGKVTCKRVVAEDAKLAHILVVAHLNQVMVQRTDESGNPLWYEIGTNGQNYTINPANADVAFGNNGAVEDQKCEIKFTYETVPVSSNSMEAFKQQALADRGHTGPTGSIGDDNGAVYPLFLIAETGRGTSTKSFRIVADTTTSRPVDYVKYIINVYENGEKAEQQMAFTLNPNIIEQGKNISLQTVVDNKSTQIRCRTFDEEIIAFMENAAYLAGLTGIDAEEFKFCDVIFGNNLYGKPLDNFIIDSSVYQLTNIVGIPLEGGDNGLFGDKPIEADTYPVEVENAFNGSYDDIIYDLDNFSVDFIFDANYSTAIKRTIERFVEFREDCFYFRDMGLGISTLKQIQMKNEQNAKSRLCATYHNSWDIIDPFSKKRITVTSTYNLAGLMVNHFLNGRDRPFCGLLYSITFPDVIEGSVNFTPKNTPSEDQKQEIDDMKINYSNYYKGLLTMETEYTSQERLTQLSWINNILTLQHLIKTIRAECPKIRYNFLDGTSLQKYKDDVQAVIDRFSTVFESITMRYVADSTYELNKIFYATIEVKMRNFVQSEYFKITIVRN